MIAFQSVDPIRATRLCAHLTKPGAQPVIRWYVGSLGTPPTLTLGFQVTCKVCEAVFHAAPGMVLFDDRLKLPFVQMKQISEGLPIA